MASGAIIAYIPDGSYQTDTLDAHVTLGFFGPAKDLEKWQIEVLKSIASDLSEKKPYYQKNPRISGRGVFVLEPQKSDGHKYAFVDLVDWNAFPMARKEVEQRAGFVDREHGFTPHLTLTFGSDWLPDIVKPGPLSEFRWASVDVWIGDDRTSYPIDYDLTDDEPSASM